MRTVLRILLLSLWTTTSFGQSKSKPAPIHVGIEQDVLPYVLKGYIGTLWIGRYYSRYRVSYAEANSPAFFLADGIAADKVKAFGISFEYFFNENFEGLWLGPGLGHWTNYLENTDGITAKNESFIFSFGGGYNFRLTNWLYTSPWVALHSRVSGNDDFMIGSTNYQPAIFTPELSIKLGVKFPIRKKD
ncbi:MAG: hypothetical protein MI810_11470 [Flavobacteriales bacterium]|nr:hypothetical protein [Flavobacteriales bacterium]